MIKNVIKKSIFVLLLLCIFSCSISNNVEEDIPVESEEEKTIDIWYVDPVEGYDDIDTWFTTRVAYGVGPYLAGSGPEDVMFAYPIMYNREDFYNEGGKYKFVIESRDRGAVLVRKNDLFGIIKENGAIAFGTTLSYWTHQDRGIVYENYKTDGKYTTIINHDYTIELESKEAGIGGGSSAMSAIFIDKDGNCIMPREGYDLSKMVSLDLFKKAVDENIVDKDGYMLVNTYASFMDCGNHFPEMKELVDTIEGYIILSNNGLELVSIPKNYVAMDFSNGVIMFSKCNKDPFRGNSDPMIFDYYAQNYYSFELCCGNYSYSDYTYVNTEGKIIGYGYEDGYGFYEGYAPVKKNGKWGYINKQGDLVIDYIFDKATTVCDGKAWVIYKGKTGRLNLLDIIENNIELNDNVLLSNN